MTKHTGLALWGMAGLITVGASGCYAFLPPPSYSGVYSLVSENYSLQRIGEDALHASSDLKKLGVGLEFALPQKLRLLQRPFRAWSGSQVEVYLALFSEDSERPGLFFNNRPENNGHLRTEEGDRVVFSFLDPSFEEDWNSPRLDDGVLSCAYYVSAGATVQITPHPTRLVSSDLTRTTYEVPSSSDKLGGPQRETDWPSMKVHTDRWYGETPEVRITFYAHRSLDRMRVSSCMRPEVGSFEAQFVYRRTDIIDTGDPRVRENPTLESEIAARAEGLEWNRSFLARTFGVPEVELNGDLRAVYRRVLGGLK